LTGKLPPNAFLHNRYLILRKIGQGGMAAVYQVSDTLQPNSLWAVKEMSDIAISSPEDRSYAIQTFEQEANLLRRLNHPNLPKVSDAFTEGGKHYLVMEFIPGQTLQSRMDARTQPFAEADVLSWAIQLCDVLGYLHNQNPKIIFRDLKPSNIMITPQNQLKLIDFGIARFFKPEKTRDTMALGTPGYAAPEAIGGQTDERSDLYSLCVTLLQLLTLIDPGRSMFNLPPARKLNPQVSIDMENLLIKGTQAKRDLRWSSAAEMRLELARLAGAHTFTSGHPAGSGFEMVTSIPGKAGNSAAAHQAPAPIPSTIAAPPQSTQRASEAAPVQPPGGTLAVPARTSRPTTRLLMVTRQLSAQQIALFGSGIIVLLIIAAWLLAPVLDQLSINWNKVPVIGLFGALGYTAYPHKGAAFFSHAVFTLILAATVWLRLGPQGYTWAALLAGVIISGAVMELWAFFLPKAKQNLPDSAAWKLEIAWMAVMAAMGCALFFSITTQGLSGWDPIQWIVGAAFGAIGWFLGDLLQQALFYRRIGLHAGRS
jgi:serine/threonine protein kinase